MALPIARRKIFVLRHFAVLPAAFRAYRSDDWLLPDSAAKFANEEGRKDYGRIGGTAGPLHQRRRSQARGKIGRASCRERASNSGRDEIVQGAGAWTTA